MHQEIKDFFYPMLSEYNTGGTVLIDATVGFGGHTTALLSLHEESVGLGGGDSFQDITVHVVDADCHMLDIAKERLRIYGNIIKYHNNFFDHFFSSLVPTSIDGILMDLGVSMYHFKEANRGFSRNDLGLLDMRLSSDLEQSASYLVNMASPDELVKIFYDYGEERQAVKWVNRIVEARKQKRIETVEDFCSALQLGKKSIDRPILTRIFQALRIAVNDELGRLERSLPLAWQALKKDGILAIISFHSLEDRIVKNFFRHVEGRFKYAQNVPIYDEGLCNTAQLLTKKPMVPSQEELKENIASRSAKLRVAKKIV